MVLHCHEWGLKDFWRQQKKRIFVGADLEDQLGGSVNLLRSDLASADPSLAG